MFAMLSTVANRATNDSRKPNEQRTDRRLLEVPAVGVRSRSAYGEACRLEVGGRCGPRSRRQPHRPWDREGASRDSNGVQSSHPYWPSSAVQIGVILTVDSGTVVGMFEHFTDGARRILVLAQVEARCLHDSSIGPEHLLLGMLREGEGIAAKALSDAGVDRARSVIEEHKRQQTGRGSGPDPFSKATMRVTERSLQIS